MPSTPLAPSMASPQPVPRRARRHEVSSDAEPLFDFNRLMLQTEFDFKHAQEGKQHMYGDVAAGFDCLAYPFESAATPSSCPKTCEICSSHYRPLHWQKEYNVLKYAEKYNDDDAQAIITGLCQATKANLRQIRGDIEAYGDVIVKRWRKKSSAKRAALLTGTLPDMLKRRTDIFIPWKIGSAKLSSFKSHMLLPYLNNEILSKDPLALLAILQCRAFADPSEWVMFDSQQLKAPFSMGSLAASYNPHCVVMEGRGHFGELTSWDLEKAHQERIFGFPRAKLVLESQLLLSTFLAQIVKLILQNGLDDAAKGNQRWHALGDTQFHDSDGADSLHRTRPAAFRSPPSLSLEKLRRSLMDRLAAASDELWLLQTDPAYVRQLLASCEGSGQYAHGSEDQRPETLVSLLTTTVDDHRAWYFVAREVEYTAKLFEDKGVTVNDQDNVPSACLEALCVLESCLRLCFKRLRNRSRALALQFGTLDEHFSFLGNSVATSKTRGDSDKDKLFWAFNQVRQHTDPDVPYPRFFLDVMEGEQQRLHPILRNCIADMMMVDEIIVSLKYHRPGFGPRLRGPPGLQHGSLHLDHWLDNDYLVNVQASLLLNTGRLWHPLEKFMRTLVISSKLSRKSLQDFYASHDALCAFWEQYRRIRIELLEKEKCPPTKFGTLLAEVQAGLSDEYKSHRQAERAQLLAEIESKEAAEEARQARLRQQQDRLPPPIWTSQEVWGSIPEQTPISPEPKVKVKTRPIDLPTPTSYDQSANDDTLAEATDDLNLNQDRILVGSDTMDIVRRMFVSYGKHAHSNMRWSDFEKALLECGVVARHDNGGSSVTFRDVARGKGSIVVHEPHDRSINPILMRSFGKRFSRNWGWEFEMFEERA